MTTIAPYGSWVSPIDAAKSLAGSTGFGSLRLDGDDLYWLESRPAEGGRVALVRRSGSAEPDEETGRRDFYPVRV